MCHPGLGHVERLFCCMRRVVCIVWGSGFRSHLVQLGSGGGDLLDAQLAELGLQLAEGLGELVLVLGPQLAGLDLCGRLQHCQLPIRGVVNRGRLVVGGGLAQQEMHSCSPITAQSFAKKSESES